jgi:hypothetical protein
LPSLHKERYLRAMWNGIKNVAGVITFLVTLAGVAGVPTMLGDTCAAILQSDVCTAEWPFLTRLVAALIMCAVVAAFFYGLGKQKGATLSSDRQTGSILIQNIHNNIYYPPATDQLEDADTDATRD